MFRRRNSGQVLMMLLLAIFSTGATSGCGIIDDIGRGGATVIRSVPKVVPAIEDAGRVGSGVIDEVPEIGSAIGAVGSAIVNNAEDVDTIILPLRSTVDDLMAGLRTQGDELSVAQRQVIKGKLAAISCEVALGMAQGEDPPADVIQDQIKSTLAGELGEAMGGELVGGSVSIVYTLAQEVNNKSGGDPFQIGRICAGLNH